MPLNRRELLGLFRDPSVLTRKRQGNAAAPICSIVIDPARCLAWQETMCLICLEACAEGAIRFQGLRDPQVVKDACTLCSDCLPVCPAAAFVATRETKRPVNQAEEGTA